MPASPEMIAAMDRLAEVLPGIDGVTGIDIGFRDEDAPDPNDLALRIFVRDIEAVPMALTQLTAPLEVPFVVIQRVFLESATFPDLNPYRPVIGGISVAAKRLIYAGTLGAIGVTTATDPPFAVGVSNWHVLCHDELRQWGDEVIQPESGSSGGPIGRLVNWSYPESVFTGVADAAICSIDEPILATPSIADLGLTAGTTTGFIGMFVQRRGKISYSSGFTTNDPGHGNYYIDKPSLPKVGIPGTGISTTMRQFVGQMLVRAVDPSPDWFGKPGDSGSVVVDRNNRIVGLFFAGGARDENSQREYGVVTPIGVVEQELAISFGPSS